MGQQGIALDGARLRQLRRNQAFTQKELCARSNVYIETLRKAEKGLPVRLTTWRRLAEALLVEPSELLPEGAEA